MPLLVLVAVITLGGCWTGGQAGSDPTVLTTAPARARVHAGFKLKLERVACTSCPQYAIVIHGDGRVDWSGNANVLAIGSRQGRVTEQEIAELERELTNVQFFERDEYGHLPLKSACTTQNGITTCSMGGSFSFCSDTAHTVITVTRKYRTHTVDNANCSDTDELAELEQMVERMANVAAWVGE